MEAVEPLREKAQIKKMKRLLKRRNLRDYALFVVGINLGLRVGDLLALTVGDVLQGRGNRLKAAERIEIREKKTHKKKRLILNETARRAVVEYLKTRTRRYPEDPLFLSRQRDKEGSLRALSRKQVWRILSETGYAAGIRESIGTHSMRKTFGYHRYNAGQPVEELQKIFNHSSAAITSAYIGINQDKIDRSYREFQL